jgi:hypothetical protein
MMDALGVSSHPCCDDVMASIDDQKSARRALSAYFTESHGGFEQIHE